MLGDLRSASTYGQKVWTSILLGNGFDLLSLDNSPPEEELLKLSDVRADGLLVPKCHNFLDASPGIIEAVRANLPIRARDNFTTFSQRVSGGIMMINGFAGSGKTHAGMLIVAANVMSNVRTIASASSNDTVDLSCLLVT